MHRREIGSRWRRLTAGRLPLLVLAHLRCGDAYTRLAAGFGIWVATRPQTWPIVTPAFFVELVVTVLF